MATKVQTTVRAAFVRMVSRLRTWRTHRDTNAQGDPLCYLWLALGIVLFPFAGVRWTIPLAAWLLPVFWLRFVRTQPIWRGSLLVLLASVLVALVDLQGIVPVSGVFYVLMVVAVCILGILPYLIDRLLTPRLGGLRGGLLGTLVFPLACTTVAYLGAATSPIGSFGNVAYTQYGNFPLLQLASVTGIWGIDFLMSWFASVVNWGWKRRFAWPQVRPGALLYGGLLALVLVFGGARLAFTPAQAQGSTVRIAGVSASRALSMAAARQFDQQVSMQSWMSLMSGMASSADSERARATVASVIARVYAPVNDDLLARSEMEARAGAKIIVWPEVGAQVLQEDEPALLAKASAIAKSTGVYLDMGIGELLLHPSVSGMMLDQIILLDPSGNVVWRYEKVHLVPGAETGMVVPGVGQLPNIQTPYGRISNVICFDADFPGTLRQAGLAGADIMLVPSNDWREIDPYHTQLITFRAVENGYSLVRQTSNGLAMTVDYDGRALAASDYFASDAQAMVAYVPVRGVGTLFTVIGDLFAWLSLLALLALISFAVAYDPR